jgi:integrase
MGKHKRIRTIPIPGWVKEAMDKWAATGRLTQGSLFRRVNKQDQIEAANLSERVVWQVLRKYANFLGLPSLAPHDLRPTFAKLCRSAR